MVGDGFKRQDVNYIICMYTVCVCPCIGVFACLALKDRLTQVSDAS